MQRLSAWFYLKNNKKRAVILILCFGLYFALLYVVQFFMHPTTYMDEVIKVQGAEKVQSAYINSLGKLNEAMNLGMDMSLWEPESGATYEELVAEINKATAGFEKLLQEEGTAEHVFVCNSYGIYINSFGGDSYYNAPMMTREELAIFTEYLDLKVIEGRLPQAPGEFMMDERMAKNRGLSVGDDLYDRETKLVGTVEYDTYIAAGIDYEENQYPDRDIYLLSNGAIPDLKEYFAGFGIEADTESIAAIEIYADKVNAIKEVEEMEQELQFPLSVMSYSIAFVLGITVFFVYRLHVQDRYTEWCLYRSLGYSEREVYSLAFREFGICMGISIGLACMITMILCAIGAAVMRSKGMFYEYILPEVLLQILGIGTLLAGVMQIPVVVAMGKVKTIDAMEED